MTERAYSAEMAMKAGSDIHKSSIFNLQSSIFNSGLSGLGLDTIEFVFIFDEHGGAEMDLGITGRIALEDYEKALNLNLMSAVHLIHGVTPAMQAQGWGRIIAITSTSVKQPIGTLLLSNMARAGLTGFLKTVATELAPSGITVNAFLASVQARYITGQNLLVDGGNYKGLL